MRVVIRNVMRGARVGDAGWGGREDPSAWAAKFAGRDVLSSEIPGQIRSQRESARFARETAARYRRAKPGLRRPSPEKDPEAWERLAAWHEAVARALESGAGRPSPARDCAGCGSASCSSCDGCSGHDAGGRTAHIERGAAEFYNGRSGRSTYRPCWFVVTTNEQGEEDDPYSRLAENSCATRAEAERKLAEWQRRQSQRDAGGGCSGGCSGCSGGQDMKVSKARKIQELRERAAPIERQLKDPSVRWTLGAARIRYLEGELAAIWRQIEKLSTSRDATRITIGQQGWLKARKPLPGGKSARLRVRAAFVESDGRVEVKSLTPGLYEGARYTVSPDEVEWDGARDASPEMQAFLARKAERKRLAEQGAAEGERMRSRLKEIRREFDRAAKKAGGYIAGAPQPYQWGRASDLVTKAIANYGLALRDLDIGSTRYDEWMRNGEQSAHLAQEAVYEMERRVAEVLRK